MSATPHIDAWYEMLGNKRLSSTLARLVRDHGYTFTPTPWSAWEGMPEGKPKACYQNAADLALDNDALTYCEGYAVRTDITSGVPMEHAWCVDADGRVIDPTWRSDDVTGWEYVGIPFTTSAMMKLVMDKMTYGLLEGELLHDGGFDVEWVPERWRS